MSSAVHSLATFLLCNKVPAQWCNLWEGPADPFEYLRALVAKTMALGLWFEKQAKGELLKDGLDLSDLFRPSAFISAVQQQTARYSLLLHDAQWDIIYNYHLVLHSIRKCTSLVDM